jgi:hypothetical protein
MRRANSLLWLLALCGCARHDPPGAEPSGSPALVEADRAAAESEPAVTDRGEEIAKDLLGTARDNLPFEPDGAKIASTAWRTWVYTDVGAQRTRYGYLRAGAIVDARGPVIVNDGCAGGWWRINPRGFVCVGKGATLDLEHPIVKATSVRPVRGQSLPYLYARAADVPPLFYFRLATKAEMAKVEGDGVVARAKRWKETARVSGLDQVIGEAGAPPDFLSPVAPLEKPYGVSKRLHLSVHSGRSAPDAGFAFQRVFEWQERTFGLSTELDIIALDRTKVVRPSSFRGVELADDEGLPVAFIEHHYAQRHRLVGNQLVASGSFGHREGVKLTGAKRGSFFETRDGSWMTSDGARMVAKRESFPSFATGNRKWIDLSIRDQTLVAYVGEKPVYATLVSTGRGGLGDPEKTHATARGTFMIYSKHVTATMDGNDDRSDSYNLLDVPFVQYFHKGYALHGTYWHDEYGRVRSHGCVNLSPIDAAWIFEWTDPPVPPGWHAVLNKHRGTVVQVRP